MKAKNALLIVDVQLDFCPGGTLAVPEGDKIIPFLNKYVKLFHKQQLPIFASRDWHPRETIHFEAHGGPWPEHCKQDTQGAEFHPTLRLPEDAIILSKGMDPKEDGYSAFQAVDTHGTAFNALLHKFGVTKLFIGGLATDYCVKWTVIDAIKFGVKVVLLLDALKGVNLKPKDSQAAIDEMVQIGAATSTLEKISRTFAKPHSA